MAGVAAQVRVSAVLASEAVEAVAADGRGRGHGSERRTFAINVDIIDPYRNLTPKSGRDLERGDCKFCNCVKVALDGGIAVATMTLPPLKQPAVLLRQRPKIRTMLIVETIRSLTIPLCLTLLSVDLRMTKALPWRANT